MAHYSGQSKDPVVLKVLVDASYFALLQDAEKFKQQYNQKTIKKLACHNSQVDPNHNTQENIDEITQTGSGAKKTSEVNGLPRSAPRRTPVDEETLRKVLPEIINTELRKYFDKPPKDFVEYLKEIKVSDVLRQVPFLHKILALEQT